MTSVLAQLLAPLRQAEFVTQYWGRRPLLLEGSNDKFRWLFDRERLDRLLVDGHDLHVRATLDRAKTFTRVDSRDAASQVERGASICVSELTRHVPELADVASQVRQELQFVGVVDFRCYWSPPGSGFGTHFDASAVTAIQLEGQKTWTYSTEPALTWPPYQTVLARPPVARPGGLDHRGVDQLGSQTSRLRPGDLLCLPPGHWHEARAGNAESLSLNLAFEFDGGLFELLAPLLRERLLRLPGWRHPPPVSTDPGEEPPAELEAYYSQRFAELHAELDRLLMDDHEILRLWHRRRL